MTGNATRAPQEVLHKTLGDLIGSGIPTPTRTERQYWQSKEPGRYFLNMFRHNRTGDIVPADHTFAEVNEAYEEISDGLTGYSYAFSFQITNKDGNRTSEIVYLEDEARAWRRS